MDTKVCQKCNTEKHWRRFRVRLGGGSMQEVEICSECRGRDQRANSARYYREKQAVLNRTNTNTPKITPKMDYAIHKHEGESFKDYQLRKASGYAYFYPKLEKQMRSYCNKKTAMDRKYLRDHDNKPLHSHPYTAKQQLQAREHAKGWIAFYEDIFNHAINLLRQTGTRPPWAQMEASIDLQKLYGVWNTKRAGLLRMKG